MLRWLGAIALFRWDEGLASQRRCQVWDTSARRPHAPQRPPGVVGSDRREAERHSVRGWCVNAQWVSAFLGAGAEAVEIPIRVSRRKLLSGRARTRCLGAAGPASV